MNQILDKLLVGALIIASLVYAVWSLGPRLLRARLLEALGLMFQRQGFVPGLGALGRRFRAAAAAKKPGCGGCDGCAPAPPASSEVSIPVEKIGRRA